MENLLGVFYYLVMFSQKYHLLLLSPEQNNSETKQKDEENRPTTSYDPSCIYLFEDENSFIFHLLSFELVGQVSKKIQLLELSSSSSTTLPLSFNDCNLTSVIYVAEKEATRNFPVHQMNSAVSLQNCCRNYELISASSNDIDVTSDRAKEKGLGSTDLINITESKFFFSCGPEINFSLRMQEKLTDCDFLLSFMSSHPDFLLLPWITVDGKLNLRNFNVFVCHIIAYLSEFPSANLSAIHSRLMILSEEFVKLLLDVLLKLEIVERRDATMTTELTGPFDSLSFWHTVPPSVPPMSEESYRYEIFL
jgi:hypothetical protein